METYCAHLHNSIYLSPTGDARPCCRYRESLNLSWNENTDDIINSPQYNELRNKADNGIPLDGCQKCYAEDRAGIESIRSRVNKKFPNPKNKLEYLEISFNNICNLKCVGCEQKSCCPCQSKRTRTYVARSFTLGDDRKPRKTLAGSAERSQPRQGPERWAAMPDVRML